MAQKKDNKIQIFYSVDGKVRFVTFSLFLILSGAVDSLAIHLLFVPRCCTSRVEGDPCPDITFPKKVPSTKGQ